MGFKVWGYGDVHAHSISLFTKPFITKLEATLRLVRSGTQISGAQVLGFACSHCIIACSHASTIIQLAHNLGLRPHWRTLSFATRYVRALKLLFLSALFRLRSIHDLFPDPQEDPKSRSLNGGSCKVPLVVSVPRLGDLLSSLNPKL